MSTNTHTENIRGFCQQLTMFVDGRCLLFFQNKDLRNLDQDDDEDALDWEEWNARNQASKRVAGKGNLFSDEFISRRQFLSSGGKHLQRQKVTLISLACTGSDQV